MPEQSYLKDARRTYHFWVDDDIFDRFGAQLGPYAGWVYCYLARRAKQRKAFPSLKRIARDTGIARSSVQKAITRLHTLGLISITTRVDENGDRDTSVYTLLDLHAPPAPALDSDSPDVPPGGMGLPPGGTGVYRQAVEGIPPGGHKGVSEKETPLKDAHVCVSDPGHTHTQGSGNGMAAPGKKKTLQPFPSNPEDQAALKSQVLTEDLHLWIATLGLDADIAREYERWLLHALARQRTTADFPADFRTWLLDPLTARTHAPLSALGADKEARAEAAVQAFVEGVTNGH